MPSYSDPGSYSDTAPSRAREAEVDLRGGEGAGDGGNGGRVTGRLTLSAGDTLYIYVGGAASGRSGGFNGGGTGGQGGNGNGGGGGGASDVRLNDDSLSGRDAVAAGGGGQGGDRVDGGAGGTSTGEKGQDGQNRDADGGDGGEGGSQSSGGAGGEAGRFGEDGGNGSLLDGGNGGGDDGTDDFNVAGGGGGAGYYGGGGGGSCGDSLDGGGGGGGGGSNYTGGIETFSNSRGYNSGDGFADITYIKEPTEPTNVSSSRDVQEVNLTWDDGVDADDVEIYRDTTSGVDTSGTPIATVTVGTESYTDTDPVSGETNYYRLVSTNDDGYRSPDSAEVSENVPPKPPENVDSTTASDTSIEVTWDAVTNAEEYRLYRDTTSGGLDFADYTQVATVAGSETSVVDTGLDNGQEYFYRVTVVLDGQESTLSNETSSVTQIPAPTDVEVSAVNGDNLTVTWTDNAGAEEGYRVYVSRDNGETWVNDSGDLPADTESYETTDLLDGEQYRVAVEVFGSSDSNNTAPGLKPL